MASVIADEARWIEDDDDDVVVEIEEEGIVFLVVMDGWSLGIVNDDDDEDGSDKEWQPLMSMSCTVTILQSGLMGCVMVGIDRVSWEDVLKGCVMVGVDRVC